MEKKFIKLSELDGKEFTVDKAYGYQYKFWDEGSRRMLVSDTYEQGYRKVYGIVTDQGGMDLSEAQMKNILVAAYKQGVADIIGKTFAVKKVVGANDIPNYYFKVVQGTPQPRPSNDLFDKEPVDIPEGW